jgi:hypothetical protein
MILDLLGGEQLVVIIFLSLPLPVNYLYCMKEKGEIRLMLKPEG